MDRIALTGDLTISRIAWGCWRLAEDDTTPAHIAEKVAACLDQGITTIDHAAVYGGYTVEALFGAALRADPGLRNRIEIVTKCGIVVDAGRHRGVRVKHYDTSRAHVEASVEASLRALGTDRIDLLLIHRPDPFMDAEATGAALDALVRAGKVRAVGVSNFRPWDWDLLQSAMETPLVANQIELSLSHLDPFTNGDLAFLQARRRPIMAWSPLGGGRLMAGGGSLAGALDALAARHGVEPAAVAVAFLLAHPARIVPVLGTNRPDRIRALAASARVPLDRKDWFALYQAALGQPVP